MKGCNTPDEFNSAIENGDIINDVRPNQTAETTVAFRHFPVATGC